MINRDKDSVAIGLDYPMQRSKGGYFGKTYTSIDQTKANIINVLATRKGERLMKPNFGTNLYRLVFEQSTKRLEERIRAEIEHAVEMWLPYVIVLDISMERSEERNAVAIDILFSSEFLGKDKEENLQLWFSLEEQ